LWLTPVYVAVEAFGRFDFVPFGRSGVLVFAVETLGRF